DYLLSIVEHLRTSYDVYQNLLDAFDAKDYKGFYECIDQLPALLDPAFKKAILYLNKHKQEIINALKYTYSNGKLEGNNNRIKVIKIVAFCFRTFRHLRMRILIQENICDII
ncbi:transposase, partial [Enterococcus avium]|uniref:transposase n=1 Tax=Enterococcus avium TaxID=33945 RepID=UPI002E133064